MAYSPTKSLQQWCVANFLVLKTEENSWYCNIGQQLCYIANTVDDFLINKNGFYFNFSESQFEELMSNEEVKIVFEFGKQWYICDKKIYKNEFNEEFIKATLNDLKYIGKANTHIQKNYCMLGVHSEYELMNGSGNSEDWIKKAKFIGCDAIGICDKNTLAGVLSFQLQAQKSGLKFIIGYTATVATNKSKKSDLKETYDLKLYVANKAGWLNLLKINKVINIDNKGFIYESELLQYSDGLIAVICSDTFFSKNRKLINFNSFVDIYYQIDTVEWYNNTKDLSHLNDIRTYLLEWKESIKPILIGDAYYLDKDMHILKDALNKINKNVADYSEDQYFKNLDEFYNQFKPYFKKISWDELFDEAVKNTMALSDSCDYMVDTNNHKIPKYKFSSKFGYENNEDLFLSEIQKNFKIKVPKERKDEYKQRLLKELDVIMRAGFVDYFLILWDIINWAKKNDIYVGTGRGSVGGSLVAYLLNITEIDPIEFDLLFERFLNESRVSGERAKSADAMPDIDIDFQTEYRDLVKEYIKRRFGKLNTCSIGTYTRLKLKGAIKDFARVKGFSFDKVNYITKKIDDQISYTFTDLFEYACLDSELYDFLQNNYQIVYLTKYALGQAKAASIHASAVIILPDYDEDGNETTFHEWLPVRELDGIYVSEWEGKYTDRFGLLKEDILGLEQLDKFKFMNKLIKKHLGTDIQINKIPLDDRNVFKLFQKGYNEDVFQFNGGGMKKYSIQVKPENIEHLIAMNALYRPGTMESNSHNEFALIKNGKKKPKYDYMLEPVTNKTFGLLIYQEQIMQSLVVLGNFTLVEADVFRTAIKKFDKNKMEQFEEKFIKGAIENNCDEATAKEIWKKLLAFSGYGFNRSHSAAYSLISYYSQWYKANYPIFFWTTAFNYSDDDTISSLISEFKKLEKDLKLRPPDINKSGVDFECDDNIGEIYWSLKKVKGIAGATIESIIETRNEIGRFSNYETFFNKVNKSKVNKGKKLALILSGAFDIAEHIKKPQERIQLIAKHYELIKEPLPDEYKDEKLIKTQYFWIMKQKELIGYGDIDYETLIKNLLYGNKLIKDYVSYERLQKCSKYTVVVVAGLVVNYREVKSKKTNNKFATITLSNNDEFINVVLWSDFYEENKDVLKMVGNKFICIKGKVGFDSYNNSNAVYSYEDTIIYQL